MFLMLTLCVCLPRVRTLAADGASTSSEENVQTSSALHNKSMQSYFVYGSRVTSSLTAVDSGYMSVECMREYYCRHSNGYYTGSSPEDILVQYYNSSFEVQSQQIIPLELSYYGGFYAGANAYYLVFGQSNTDEDDSREVVRIVKYSKNWKRLGSASLKGADTTVPFDAGSLRMAEANGYLYVRTCHKMYASPDGVRHQGNMTIAIRESDMALAGFTNFDTSHTFNQFILFDDAGNLITLDHGDGNPARGALLRRFGKASGESYPFARGLYYGYFNNENNTRVSVLSYAGNSGNNYTGSSVGGLEYSDSCYLTAGSSIVQNGENRITRNIYITATKRDNFSSAGTDFTWITDYAEGGTISASTPHLVKLSSNSFLLLWEQLVNYNTHSGTPNGTLCYVFLDGKGKPTGSVHTKKGCLSDCKPIVSGSSIIWQTAEYGKVTFYTLKTDGTLTSKQATPALTSIANTSSGVKLTWNAAPGAAKYRVYRKECDSFEEGTGSITITKEWSLLKTTASTSYTDTTAVCGTTYAYTIRCLDSSGKFTVSTALNYHIGGLSIKYLASPELISLKNSTDGITITWGGVGTSGYANINYATGYYIYRKNASGEWKKIETFTPDCTYRSRYSWTDTNVYDNQTYSYTVQAYYSSSYISGGKYISSYNSTGPQLKRISQPAVSGLSRQNNGIVVKWNKVSGAESYNIYRIRYYSSTSYSTKQIGTVASSASSFTDTDVTCGTWHYVIEAVSGSTSSDCSSTMDGPHITYAARPVLSEISAGEKGVTVKWTPVSGASGYNIYRKTGSGSWKKVGSSDSYSYTDTGAVSGTSYAYTVQSCYSDESGEALSTYDNTGLSIYYLAQPSITSLSNLNNGVLIKWNKVNGARSYNIYRIRYYSDYSYSFTKVGTTATVSFTDTDADCSQTYYYTVQAVSGSVYSSYTISKDNRHIVTLSAAPVLSSSANTSKGITVKWNAVSGTTRYRVYRRITGGSWAKIADTASASYTDTTAKNGTTYRYTVRCLSKDGKTCTSRYNTTGLSIKRLSQPSVASAVNTASGVTVKWGKVTGASGYYIYRKTGSGSLTKIKTVTGSSTLSYTDTAVKSKNGTTCVYTVRAYSGSSTGIMSGGKKIIRLTTPSITSAANTSSRKLTVKWSKNSSASGYQIKYTADPVSKTITVSGTSSVSKTISGLAKGKTCKVYIRAYKTVSGVNYYSAWSSAKSVKITK